MKKIVLFGASVLAMGTLMTSCVSHDFDTSRQDYWKNYYEQKFIEAFGQVSANQDWGFGSTSASRMTRSFASPECPDVTQPVDETWVASYLETAKEPDATNTNDNYDNTTYATNWTVLNAIPYDGSEEDQLRQWFASNQGGLSWDELVAWAKANRPTWISYNQDETFVTNFKITGTYTGTIAVAASEGYTTTNVNGETVYGDRMDPFLARTVVVTGTWNINDNQRMGSGSTIVIANGGKVNVASGKQLQTVNQARIIVLPGGELAGAGSVEVSNGNGVGGENWNGGTVSVAKFNNNFGKFFNYGKFLVSEYVGGAKESNFYNHGLVHIQFTGLNNETPNARIFNACQWYCENNMRCRNYEGIQGSSFIIGGQLMMSSSEDGTTTPTYVGLAAGALVQAGSLYNNGTSWSGPADGGYAVLSIGKFDYMNWEQDHPELGGYFANNLYLQADDLSNVPDGNGYHQTDPSDAYNHSLSIAEYKFKNIVANATGNGNVTVVEKGDYEIIPASDDFELGVKGCTPGFKIKKDDDDPNKPEVRNLRILAEDISASDKSDFDFNDVVFDVEATYPVGTSSVNQVKITVWAAGGTLPLRINSNNGVGGFEVHDVLGTTVKTMTNTHAEKRADGKKYFWADDVEPYVETVTVLNNASIRKDYFAEDVNNNLRVEVFKYHDDKEETGEWVELTAVRGMVASKIGVPVGTPWSLERRNMGNVFTQFTQWVNNADPNDWYNSKVEAQIYNEGKNHLYKQR